MGNLVSLNDLFNGNSYHVIILGVDNAGKTTTLYRLRLGQYIQTAPTIGFNCEQVCC